MKEISVKCPTAGEKIGGVFCGFIISYIPFITLIKNGWNLDLGVLVMGVLIATLGVILASASLYGLLFLRGNSFEADCYQLRWRHIFGSGAILLKDIKNFEINKSIETSGYMIIESKNGDKFKIPGNCYECKIHEVESFMYGIFCE